MRAGTLRVRGTIQTPDDAGSSWGGESSWSTVATVWCSVEPLTGGEYFAARQTNAEVTHKIKLRYANGLKPSMRLYARGKYYKFTAIRNIETRDREIEIMATEEIR